MKAGKVQKSKQKVRQTSMVNTNTDDNRRTISNQTLRLLKRNEKKMERTTSTTTESCETVASLMSPPTSCCCCITALFMEQKMLPFSRNRWASLNFTRLYIVITIYIYLQLRSFARFFTGRVSNISFFKCEKNVYHFTL